MSSSSPPDGVDAGAGEKAAARGAGPTEGSAPPPVPSPPESASAVFGDRLELAVRFAAELSDTGVTHGLIGPREVPRIWERHLLNCAVVADAFPTGAEVVDVGSGAGLPGIALAIVRPDLEMHLVEPMARRTEWLEETIARLELSSVRVHRGRAEDLSGEVSAPWVTARAVARVDRLLRWSRPLLTGEGTLVALKGRTAGEELERQRPALERLGVVDARVSLHGEGLLDPPTTTLDLRVRPVRPTSPARSRRRRPRP